MEPASETEKNTDDPFAADIFATPADREKRRAETAENEQPALELKHENLWSSHLPQVHSADVFRSAQQINLLQHFSVEMLDSLSEALARLLALTSQRSVEFLLTAKREISRAEEFWPENGCWLTITNGGAEIFFEIGDALALWLVETALDPLKVSDPVVLRPLTLTEAAVLEYLVLNLTQAANLHLQSTQIRYRSLSREIPAALQRKFTGPENFSLLIYEFQTAKDATPGAFKIYLTGEALKAFSPDDNLRKRMREQIILNLPEQLKDIRARFVCGHTDLAFGELAALENGDVLLFDTQGVSANKPAFTPSAEILLGDGDKQKIIGEFRNSGLLRDAFFLEENIKTDHKASVRRLSLADQISITVKSLARFESSPPDIFMIETNDNLTSENAPEDSTAAEQGNNLAIENLAVSLRIELEARHLPLSEIAGLRENQTLELSVRPTDEVNILVNDRAIGRGELVLIEGERLGVKITKLIR